jgi:hypothetical protein
VTAARDLPALDGFTTCYGVQVCTVGEDGILIALGHHPARTALAAFNAYSRRVIGLADVTDGQWVQPVGPLLEKVKQDRGRLLGECGECPPERGCDRCLAIRDGSWWMELGADKADPDAFPVTVLEI